MLQVNDITSTTTLTTQQRNTNIST